MEKLCLPWLLQTEAVRKQLESGNVVLLSNLGYSAAGEVLNCDTYTVATRAAVDLQVHKGHKAGRVERRHLGLVTREGVVALITQTCS